MDRRSDAPVLLEIGSRRGGFLAELARRNPGAECVGIEYRKTWVREARRKASRQSLANLRYVCADAREVVGELLLPGELSEVYVLFPDPWHKKRHLPRRLLQPAFLTQLARVMRTGAPLYVLTDVADYARCLRADLQLVEALEPLPRAAWPDESRWGPCRMHSSPGLLAGAVERIYLRRRS